MAVTKITASTLEGGLKVNGIKVIGEQVAVEAQITDSTGGSTTGDVINDTTASVKDDLAILAKKINAILTCLKTHGLMASS